MVKPSKALTRSVRPGPCRSPSLAGLAALREPCGCSTGMSSAAQVRGSRTGPSRHSLPSPVFGFSLLRSSTCSSDATRMLWPYTYCSDRTSGSESHWVHPGWPEPGHACFSAEQAGRWSDSGELKVSSWQGNCIATSYGYSEVTSTLFWLGTTAARYPRSASPAGQAEEDKPEWPWLLTSPRFLNRWPVGTSMRRCV